MTNITTLIPDIYNYLSEQGGWENVDWSKVTSKLQQANEPVHRRGLRLSGLGPKCPRALWFSVHHPELAEALPPYARIKYQYGHIIEAMIIELARVTGHTVQGEQDEIVLDGIVGHRDCVIDGAIVDVKSASSIGFKKFKDKAIASSDDFGYLDQLDAYVVGSVMADDPLVTEREKGYNLAVDKTLGHLCLYEHYVRPRRIRERIARYKEIVSSVNAPRCECETVPDGKSGNIRLSTKAAYSAYKHSCFPQLRTFLYSNGPVDLVKVVRLPDVPELDKNRKIVYH